MMNTCSMKFMVKMKTVSFNFKNEGTFWLTQYIYMWIHMCTYVFAFLTKTQSPRGYRLTYFSLCFWKCVRSTLRVEMGISSYGCLLTLGIY